MKNCKSKGMLIYLMAFFVISCTSNKMNDHFQNIQEAQELSSVQEYSIGKGDLLEIITWKEPDFSREVPVRIDGKISFPLLDDIQASGRTCSAVRDEIQEELKEFVNHPVVSVSVKVSGSQRFYVTGEVMKPGEYPILKETSVLQAFALAGGFTEWASKKEILLIRMINGEKKMITINYKDIENGEGAAQDIPLEADDIIVVP